jgi:hypothetical protein
MAKGSDEDTLARRRWAVSIALLGADRLADETAAFDVLVNGSPAGHWSETVGGRAAVAWVGGELVETELCDGEEEKVKAAIRPSIPASRLKPEESMPPKYDVAKVEAVILEVAVELDSEHLSTGSLLLKVVGDPEDAGEIETGVQAIRSLREAGLFAHRDDEIVEPTQAAVRAIRLLT